MRTVVLLISLAFIFAHNTEAYNPVDLLGSLKSQIKNMTILIHIIKDAYSDELYYHRPPREYYVTLYRAQVALNEAKTIFDEPKFTRKDKFYNSRDTARRLNSRPGWYTEGRRSLGFVEGPIEEQINPRPWDAQKWSKNRRSMGDRWNPKKSYLRHPTDRHHDDHEWSTRFYKALSMVLRKELKEEPLVADRVGEGYEPPPVLFKRDKKLDEPFSYK